MTLDHVIGALVGLALGPALRALWCRLTRARERSPHTRERLQDFIKRGDL